MRVKSSVLSASLAAAGAETLRRLHKVEGKCCVGCCRAVLENRGSEKCVCSLAALGVSSAGEAVGADRENALPR